MTRAIIEVEAIGFRLPPGLSYREDVIIEPLLERIPPDPAARFRAALADPELRVGHIDELAFSTELTLVDARVHAVP